MILELLQTFGIGCAIGGAVWLFGHTVLITRHFFK